LFQTRMRIRSAPRNSYVFQLPDKKPLMIVLCVCQGKWIGANTLAEIPETDGSYLLTHTGGTGDIFGPELTAHRLEVRTLNDYIGLYVLDFGGDRGRHVHRHGQSRHRE
jgi:hypothetical protein